MLFALDWINETYQAVANAIAGFIGGMTLPVIEAALSTKLWVLIPCVIMGVVLCLYGFRLHKLVNGLVGGALLGWFGWNLGLVLNSTLITVPILYSMMMAVLGFTLMYIVYVFNIFPAAFLIAWASCAGFSGISTGMRLLVACAVALAYCILYVRGKAVMTALTGAILLGLIAGGRHDVMTGAAVCSTCTAFGVLLQASFKKRYDEKMAAERAAEIEKYPFGPGERDKRKAERAANAAATQSAAVQR